MHPQATLLLLLLLQMTLVSFVRLGGFMLPLPCERLLVDPRQIIDVPHFVAQLVAFFPVLLGDVTVLRRRRVILQINPRLRETGATQGHTGQQYPFHHDSLIQHFNPCKGSLSSRSAMPPAFPPDAAHAARR